MDFKPWAKHPALTEQRLATVAAIMRDVRNKAADLHDAAEGDNAWSRGCRVYARTCFALRRSAAEFDWLSVLPESEALRFTFAVGRVPLKFYRGDASDAPGHCKIMSDAEAAAQQLLLDLGEIPDDGHLLRLVVESDSEGRTLTVTLIELDKAGALTGKYVIPSISGTDVIPALARGIDPGPPQIQPLPRVEDRKRRSEGNGE